MTNCFWDALLRSLKPRDFIHFPYLHSQTPAVLFAPYFKNRAAFAELLEKLASTQHAMYYYPIPNDEVPGVVLPHVLSHVLNDGVLVSPRIAGDWIENIKTKEFDLVQTLSQGYYSCGSGDGVLTLLCEFTGIEFRNKLPAYTVVYKRLNTPCNTIIELESTGNKDNGHASFKRRIDMPPTPPPTFSTFSSFPVKRKRS